MYEVLLKTFVTFLVIYALIDIVSRFFGFFVKGKNHSGETLVVIKVKNQEANLEYIVRSVIWRFLNKNGGTKVPYILIVDLGSDDSTNVIAQKLSEDYEFIYYATENKYNEMKKQFLV